jgi:hypothetical protein
MPALPPERPFEDFPSPSEFKGNFQGYIERLREILEPTYGEDSGPFQTVADRAEAEAQYYAARNWLVERWGDHSPCPICQNVEWTVSWVAPAIRPAGFLSFYVTCGYCGNAMQVVPGNAPMDAPRFAGEQLHFPAGE